MADREEDPAPGELPLVDEEHIAQLEGILGQGSQDIQGIVEAFLSDAPANRAALEEAIRSQDPQALAHAAHKIKGSARTLGAKRLSERCTTLEAKAQDGETVGVDQIEPLARLFEQTEQAIRERLLDP